MADKHRVEVEILGQKYTIRSEASPEYVRELGAYVEKRARELRAGGAGPDPVKLLALAALYIADELFRARDDQAEAERDAGARLGAMRDFLDSIAAER